MLQLEDWNSHTPPVQNCPLFKKGFHGQKAIHLTCINSTSLTFPWLLRFRNILIFKRAYNIFHKKRRKKSRTCETHKTVGTVLNNNPNWSKDTRLWWNWWTLRHIPVHTPWHLLQSATNRVNIYWLQTHVHTVSLTALHQKDSTVNQDKETAETAKSYKFTRRKCSADSHSTQKKIARLSCDLV